MEATVRCPTELMFDIFSRLPSKPLALSKCVSKWVRAKIANPTFVSMHHNRSVSNRSGCIMQFIRNNQTCVSSFNEEFTISNDFMIKLPDDDIFHGDNGINIIGSSNGLLCFTRNGLPLCTYLWNPSMTVAKKLPQPFVIDLGLDGQDWSSSFHLTGFGFDRESDDYKLVQIIFEKPDRRYAYDCRECAYDISRVYSLKTNSWRLVKSKLWNDFVPCISDPLTLKSGTCFKDSLYWKSLTLFVQYQNATRVWFLKESKDGVGSWTKGFDIDLGFLACPIDFVVNGKLLMMRLYPQRRRTQLPLAIHSPTTTFLCRLGLWDFEEKKFGELRINVDGEEEDIQQVLDVHSFERAQNHVKLRNLMDY
ncbi:hypothetical protein FNV43_RR20726 [Rhamnella rubrinervis]|uniref:F-box associated beta-propeller type 1 domain-containing protein n=1 Tax=Rhamnella rubrinervis TaxID=2594499 RepID=A0A8K0E1Z3_9ROSA|nr:hypothetical protein FNV43_RR20726 [Rhamnella rubrinervis]